MAIDEGAAPAAAEIAPASDVSVAACCDPPKRLTSTLDSETAMLTTGRGEGEGELKSGARKEAVEVPVEVAVADAVVEPDVEYDAVIVATLETLGTGVPDAVKDAALEVLGKAVAAAELEEDVVAVAVKSLWVDDDVQLAVAEEDDVGSTDSVTKDEREVVADAVAEAVPLTDGVNDDVKDVDTDGVTDIVPEVDADADTVAVADAVAEDDVVEVRVRESVADIVMLTEVVALEVALEDVDVVADAVLLAVPLSEVDGEFVVVTDGDSDIEHELEVVTEVDAVAVAEEVAEDVGTGEHDGETPPAQDQLLSEPFERVADAPTKYGAHEKE